MAKPVEMNATRAHQCVLDAPSIDAAAQYLCSEVGIDTVQKLSQKAGVAYGSDTAMMQWCRRLATRLQLLAHMEGR